jgi:hypothetical protein
MGTSQARPGFHCWSELAITVWSQQPGSWFSIWAAMKAEIAVERAAALESSAGNIAGARLEPLVG